MNQYKDSYTNKILIKSFIELLETKSINEISVTTLTNHAQISRATFYRHYSSIESFLFVYIEYLIREFNDTNQYLKELNIVSFVYNLSKHLYNHKNFFIVIFRQNIPEKIIPIIKNYLTNYFPINDEIDPYRLNAFAYGLYGWFENWIKDGMQITPDELLKLMKKHNLDDFYI